MLPAFIRTWKGGPLTASAVFSDGGASLTFYFCGDRFRRRRAARLQAEILVDHQRIGMFEDFGPRYKAFACFNASAEI